VSSSPVIEVIDASVSYMIRHGASPTLKETVIQSLKGQSQDVEVKAIQNLSFSLNPAEVLAVIGRNGAGKSTLLKMLARVLPPTKGRVIVRGNVSPMIELGAGFNGELNGIENIVLYGTLLGRTPKQMRQRAADISAWAGLDESINLPLRTYSSGMVARLAFAIATDIVSDLILIDEVLSVGDAEFQKKSKKKIEESVKSNAAVVLVTHDLQAVREMAHKALWIDYGRAMKYGDVDSVVDAYLNA
jgi:ABC-type polysaccharide/polyol phosphate transport system ATPase subunit